MKDLSPELIKELQSTQSNNLFFTKNLKISSINYSDKGFLKLMCIQSRPIKVDATLVNRATDWTFVNQLLQVKVYKKDIIEEILKKKKMQTVMCSLLYFDWVCLEELGRVGIFNGLSKNKYPIFWARDEHYKLDSNNFELSLR